MKVGSSTREQGGFARSPGIAWQELMAQDSRSAPGCLTDES